MTSFQREADLLFVQATSTRLIQFFDVQNAETVKKMREIQQRSQNIRSAVILLCCTPSDVQTYAQNLRLSVCQDIKGFYSSRMAAVINHLFGNSTGHKVLQKTIEELQEELNTILQSGKSEDELKTCTMNFWNKVHVYCYARLRAMNPEKYSASTMKILGECLRIHFGTLVGNKFSKDRTLNPAHTNLLDQHLASVHATPALPLS